MSPGHGKDPEFGSQRSAEVAAGSTVTRPPVGAQLRQIARRLHFLAGILVAPYLLVLSLTGLVYVFSPQVHDQLYAGQLHVNQVGHAPRPVAEQVAAALAAHPEARLRSVVPAPEPDRTTRVNLDVPGLAEPGAARTVFVDPYTNYISGELTTVDDRMPANIWLRDLHGNLHLGEAGRLYSEIATSWLAVIVIGGLVLWLGKQGRRPRRASEVLVPFPRGAGGQTRTRTVHGPLGLWLAAGLLAIAATGLIMSPFAGRGLSDASVPALAMAPVNVPMNAAGPVGPDRVLEVARAQGLSGELKVTPPVAKDRPFSVAEMSPGLPIRKDSIAVNPYTAEVTERVGWADYPLMAKFRVLGVEAHTGTLFGLANQIILMLLVIGAIVLIVGGYRMWWLRSPYRGKPPPVPDPVLRRLSRPVAVAVGIVTIAFGWLLPTFGLSLIAFVVMDLVIKAVRQPRQRARSTIAAGALAVAGAILGTVLLADMSAVVDQDPHRGNGTFVGGGAFPGNVPAPGGVLAQPPAGGQSPSQGAPNTRTAPPVSGGLGTLPGIRVQPPLNTAAGPGSASSTTEGRGTRPGGGRSGGDGSGGADRSGGSGERGAGAGGARGTEAVAASPVPAARENVAPEPSSSTFSTTADSLTNLLRPRGSGP